MDYFIASMIWSLLGLLTGLILGRAWCAAHWRGHR